MRESVCVCVYLSVGFEFRNSIHTLVIFRDFAQELKSLEHFQLIVFKLCPINISKLWDCKLDTIIKSFLCHNFDIICSLSIYFTKSICSTFWVPLHDK